MDKNLRRVQRLSIKGKEPENDGGEKKLQPVWEGKGKKENDRNS
jgi:hypothetical protein